jgi:hypothetical protein
VVAERIGGLRQTMGELANPGLSSRRAAHRQSSSPAIPARVKLSGGIFLDSVSATSKAVRPFRDCWWGITFAKSGDESPHSKVADRQRLSGGRGFSGNFGTIRAGSVILFPELLV